MALQHTALGALLLTAGGSLADECCCGGPPPDECTWFLSPDALQFDCNAQSGSFNINVPTGTNCGWEASVTSGGAYLTITAGFTGNTDGTVEFDLLGNPDPQRTAEITVVTTVVSPLGPIGTVIGVFTLTQEACEGAPFVPGGGGGSPPAPGSTCSWSVSPTNFLLSCFPQGAFFNVNTQLGCGWEAVIISGGSFITITSGTPGGDAGSVFFTVSANAGVARGGQIEVRTTVTSSSGPIGTVVGIVNIAQLVCPGGGGGAPCSWGIGPDWYVSNPCDGETGTATVFTYAGCGWEAIAQAPWITITSGSTGLSTGTITFDIDENKDGLERTGYIFVYSTTASVLGPAGLKIGTIAVREPDCASVLLEPTMRAAQERRARTNTAPTVIYPNRRFDENGLIAGAGEAPPLEAGALFYTGNASSYSMPPNYFYYYDLLNYDAFFVQPAGTRAAQLVNTIRTNINSDVLLNLYWDQAFPIQGAAAITVYNTGSLPVPAAATTADYEDRLIDLRNGIRLLEFLPLQATDTAVVGRMRSIDSTEATLAASKACSESNYGGVPDGFNQLRTAGCVFSSDTPAVNDPNGIFVGDAGGGSTRCYIRTGRWTMAANDAPYITILSEEMYCKFNGIGDPSEYFAPTPFGSPAQGVFALIRTGTASTFFTQAEIQADLSAMVAAINGADPVKSWGVLLGGCSALIQLGFTTII